MSPAVWWEILLNFDSIITQEVVQNELAEVLSHAPLCLIPVAVEPQNLMVVV